MYNNVLFYTTNSLGSNSNKPTFLQQMFSIFKNGKHLVAFYFLVQW
jgi:hypothetical protein